MSHDDLPSAPAAKGSSLLNRIAALLLALLALGSIAAAADASRAGKQHAIKLTIRENGISSTNPNPSGPPPVGTKYLNAGVATQHPGGTGANVDRFTITGLSLATSSDTFTGKTTILLLNGTLSAKIVGTATHHANGSDTFTGTGTYTSGTGAYKHVSGHLTFTGLNPNTPGSVTTLHATGTATY